MSTIPGSRETAAALAGLFPLAAASPRGAVRRAAMALAGLAALMLCAFAPAAAQTQDWTGEWQTFWRGGSAILTLEQTGDRVTGSYEPGGGRVEGQVVGDALRGRWRQRGNSGEFVFALTTDGEAFTGRYESGEYWNGQRASEGEDGIARFYGTGAPRETLRSFLAAYNQAVYEGDLAAMRHAARLLRFEGNAADAREETVRRRLLWDLIDISTFRLRDAPGALPAEAPGDLAADRVRSFRIGPDGASARMELRFGREGAGWRILVPSRASLRADLAEVLDELGHESLDELVAARADSPRGALRRFILGTHDWQGTGREQALAALDLSFLPAQLRDVQAPVLADYLKRVLDRTGFVTWQEIPNDPDRVTPYEHYRHPEGSIVIARVEDREGEGSSWRFTAETLRGAPTLFNAMQHLPVSAAIKNRAPFTEFFLLREEIRKAAPALIERYSLLEAWQWIALVVAAAAALLIGWTVGRLVVAIMSWVVSRNHLRIEHETVEGLDWPLRIALAGMVMVMAFGWLGLAQSALDGASLALTVVTTVAFGLLLFRLVGALGGHLRRRAEETPGFVDQIFVSLAGGLLQLFVVVGTLLALAEAVGLPYEGVITGLGVGGIALAFAARDTVSNLLGGAILMADRPFKQGDLVETDQGFSTVETVGLRSTRLRTLDDSLLIVPNSQLSDRAILNWGRRRKRKVLLAIGLTYDTPREKLDRFVERLTEVYREHPRADASSAWIGLSGFGPSSIDIELWGYFNVFSYDAFVEERSRLVGDIVDLAAETGVSFAFPTRTVHVAPSAETAEPVEPDAAPATPAPAASG